MSNSNLPRVVILGAGPAGLGAAYRLRKEGKAEVTVLESGPRVGGNSDGLFLHGIPVDYGSHRLHPRCEPTRFAPNIRQGELDELETAKN